MRGEFEQTLVVGRLGESSGPAEAPKLGIPLSEILDAFYSFLSPPRLDSAEAIRKAVIEGVTQGLFAYTSGTAPTPSRSRLCRSRLAAKNFTAEAPATIQNRPCHAAASTTPNPRESKAACHHTAESASHDSYRQSASAALASACCHCHSTKPSPSSVTRSTVAESVATAGLRLHQRQARSARPVWRA